MSVNFFDFLAVDEIGQTLKADFDITRTWFDSRLTFLHIQEDRDLNYLWEKNYQRMWYPQIYFANVDRIKGFNERHLLFTLLRDMTISPIIESPGTTNATKVFKGSKHKIERIQRYTYFWRCIFDLRWYPFDRQMCNMRMKMPRRYQKFLRLNPEKVEQKGIKAELTEYSVDKILFCSATNGTELVFSVTLGRPLLGSILTIYIPTLLLLVIRFEKYDSLNHFDMKHSPISCFQPLHTSVC